MNERIFKEVISLRVDCLFLFAVLLLSLLFFHFLVFLDDILTIALIKTSVNLPLETKLSKSSLLFIHLCLQMYEDEEDDAVWRAVDRILDGALSPDSDE
eukprot:g71943.t1